MRDIIYENNLNHSYMILEPERKDDIENYQIRMIGENQINGLLPCMIRELDGKAKVYYEITSCEELRKRYENKEISFEECRYILTAIQKTLYKMQEYLLDGDHICLNEQYMFWDDNNHELKLMFLPKKESSLQESLKRFAEYMLEKVDHTDDSAVFVAYHFYKDSRIDHFSMKSVIQSLNEAEIKRAKLHTEVLKKKEQEKGEITTSVIEQDCYEKPIEETQSIYEMDRKNKETGIYQTEDNISESRKGTKKENVLPFRNEKANVKKEHKKKEEKSEHMEESKLPVLKEYKNSVLFLVMAVVMGMIYLFAQLGDTASKGCLFGLILCLVLSYYQYYGIKKKMQEGKTSQKDGKDVVELPHYQNPSQRSFTYTNNPYEYEPTTKLDQYKADDLSFEVWNPDKAVM